MHRASPIASVELVDGLHQALPFVLLLGTHRYQQVGLKGVDALEVLHQDSRFGEGTVRAKDVVDQGQRRLEQNSSVVAG